MAESYVVAAVAVPSHADPTGTSTDAGIVVPEDLQRVVTVFGGVFGESVRARWGARGGTVIAPAADLPADRVDRLFAALSAEAGVAVTATIVLGSPARIVESIDRARELLEVVHRLGLRPGPYRFADLALEYQLTRPGPGRDRLEEMLAPLERRFELWETLRSYIANGHLRGRTARELKIHPNTVDNRLKRVARLTGCDPLRPEGIWCLRSALVVYAYRYGATSAPHPADLALALP
ncbi:PucR family transcriptional regulator [Nocardia bovistercoris]|uniref:Helix-turn-helix domain-containing protein n=1 Tax=Nocardia bovistercoris TaxID=2785916 RepID=A0A931N0T5_9NOCA|nr:helix-turn-helix domain-containing protein [Nocardia bovistercoris]MBH0775309.1 helix-turn-helix domain-containing protein [Nocardia bovistercoris]